MKRLYCILAAGLFVCCLAVPSFVQSGDTQNATGKKVPSGATGSMGSGGITGTAPVGAMGTVPVGAAGTVPVGAAGSMGSGRVTGKMAPTGAIGGDTQGATGGMQERNNRGTDNMDE
jgi:hypothetical protein